MTNVILVLNAGSSSIKFALIDPNNLHAPAFIQGQVEGIGAEGRLIAKDASKQILANQSLTFEDKTSKSPHQLGLKALFDFLSQHAKDLTICAIGHRIVHGGSLFTQPVVLDVNTVNELKQFISLAPLHQPHNIAGVEACFELLPHTPQVACFDTAFHSKQPSIAQQFALPRKYTEEGVKRYGFHGLSYEYINTQLPLHLNSLAQGRIVVAHLGNGASMCAIKHGESQASTMGFTAVDGLMMGTRTGNLDPGVLLYLMDKHQMNSHDITRVLYKESGLLGVSEISQDMRVLLESDDHKAIEAIELFCYRLIRELGSLVFALQGLDAIVFTGGIGEHAALIRQKVCQQLEWMGLVLDIEANSQNKTLISAATSQIKVLTIPTNEESMIAQHTQALLKI